MIFDKLTQAKRYLGEYPYLNEALDFIANHDLHNLPLGKTEINGEKLFVNVMEATTVDPTKTSFEVHHHYMDIQIDLLGEELLKVGYGKEENLVFDEKTDFGTVTPEKYVDIHLTPGVFVAVFPKEPHQPTLQLEEAKKIKKCVFKVWIE